MISLIFKPYATLPKTINLEHVTDYLWPNPPARKNEIKLLKGKATQYSGFQTTDKILIINGFTENESLYINIMKEYLVNPPVKALAPDEFLNVREEYLWVSIDDQTFEMRWAKEPYFNERKVNDGLVFDYQLTFKLIKEVEI